MKLALLPSRPLPELRAALLPVAGLAGRGSARIAEMRFTLFLLATLVSGPLCPPAQTLTPLSKTDVDPDSFAGNSVGNVDAPIRPATGATFSADGLGALGVPNGYPISKVAASYSALFQMDYKDSYTPGKDHDNRGASPYLGLACDHFHGAKECPIGNRDSPLTWERRASQADYAGLRVLDPIYVKAKLSVPHTWHGSEVFLYLPKRSLAPVR